MTYNYHIHTKRCGHATGEMENYVLRTIENDIKYMGFSEHISFQSPDGPSVISNGKHKGIYLLEYIKDNPEVLGTGRKTDELPILVKLIDAEDDLSIQVHPDDEQAQKWENQNGKTEMWYVLDTQKNEKIIYGLKTDVTKDVLKDAIVNNTVESLLSCVDSQKGDVFFVDAGTIHAIKKGNVIVEIQQNSNVTYRLYDYDRKDKDGNTRELHIDKGIEAVNTKATDKRKIPTCSDGTRLIGACEYFAVKELQINDKVHMDCDLRSYQVLIVVEGSVKLTNSVTDEILDIAETVFLPAGFGEYKLSGNGKVLLVENPPIYSVGIDLGGTNIVAAVVDENGVVYGRSKCKTNAPRNYKEIFSDMIVCVKEAVYKSGLLWNDIENVGIGCPGAIDKEKGVIDFSNNLDFYNVPIQQYMEQELKKKVYIENDANCAAWGEYLSGAGKDANNMVLLTLGTGVGSGIIINKHLFRGAFGTGAELGHMVVIADGRKCTCGRKGCLEAYASATALVEQTKECVKNNPKSKIWDVIDRKIDNIEGKTVFECRDDIVSSKVINEYLNYLSEGIVNITNIFQPEVICLGGGVSGAGNILTEPLNETVKQKAFARYGNRHTKIEIASLGNDAGLIGAGLLWKDAIDGVLFAENYYKDR